jgi:hypothetical protein
MGPLSLSACLHQLFVEFTLTNFDDRSQISEGSGLQFRPSPCQIQSVSKLIEQSRHPYRQVAFGRTAGPAAFFDQSLFALLGRI